jgi:hypothetical protein
VHPGILPDYIIVLVEPKGDKREDGLNPLVRKGVLMGQLRAADAGGAFVWKALPSDLAARPDEMFLADSAGRPSDRVLVGLERPGYFFLSSSVGTRLSMNLIKTS